MLMAVAGVLVAVAVLAMIPVFQNPPSMKKLQADLQRIDDGTYTDGEHAAMLHRTAREHTLAVVSHGALLGVQVCFLLAWHSPWWLAVLFLAIAVIDVLLIRRALERRRFFQGRLQEFTDEVVQRAKVDEEAERILRHGE